MINKKDNVIEFVERLEAKKRAEQKVLEQTTQSPNIKKSLTERPDDLLQNLIALAQEDQSIQKLEQKKMPRYQEKNGSFMDRWIFKIVNSRYPNLTNNLRKNQRAFFAKQFKSMIFVIVLMIFWIEFCSPFIMSEFAPEIIFLQWFSNSVSVVLYLLMGAFIFRISTRQGLLDVLQMDRISQKK